MNKRVFSVAILIYGAAAFSGWAADLPESLPEDDAASPFFQSLARVDRQLTEAQRQLVSAKNPQLALRLRAQITQLEAQRQNLIAQIEHLLEPKATAPPTQEDSISPLEQQLNSQRIHHEAILGQDKDLQRPR